MQRSMIRTVRRWNATRIQRQAPLIRQPTLLLWGEDDHHIPLRDGFYLRDAIPNSRLIVFRNCGHLPPTEYPEKFVEVVAEFCQAQAAGKERPKPLKFQPRKKHS